MLPSNTIITTICGEQDLDQIVNNLTSIDYTACSYNTKKLKPTSSDIVATRSSSSKDFIYIQVESGNSIIMTHDHKAFVDGKFARADKISPGMSVLNSSYEPDNVVDIHKIQNNTSQKVYNLTVIDTQCFFANNILVHNDS